MQKQITLKWPDKWGPAPIGLIDAIKKHLPEGATVFDITAALDRAPDAIAEASAMACCLAYGGSTKGDNFEELVNGLAANIREYLVTEISIP